jgi:hypothetical protein
MRISGWKETAAICLIMVTGMGFSQAPEKKQGSEVSSAEAKPGAAEMKRLGFYVGDWSYTETYPKSAMYPQGATNTGIYTSKLGPGGNSLINTFHSRGPAGDFEGLLVMTWDPKEQKYKSYIFGNSFPGAVIETGAFEGQKLVFRGEFSNLKLRNATWMEPSGKLISEEFMSSNGAPEMLLVRVEATKQ